MKKIIMTSHKPLVLMIVGFGVGVFLFWAGLVLAQGNFGVNDLTNTGLGTRDLKDVIVNIVNIVLGFLTAVTVILFIYGGYVWMTAGGNEENIAKAKKILTNTAIGLAIVLSSYGIARFIILQFVGGSGSGAGGGEKTCFDQVGPNICNGGCSRCILSGGGKWDWARDNTCNPGMCGLPSSSFRVNWVYPTDGQKDVSLCSIIQAKFTGNIDEATINSSNIKITKKSGEIVAGDFSCLGPGGAAAPCGADSDKGNWFKFDPTADYDSATNYEVLITNGVKEDTTGIAVEGRLWSFTTGSTTDTTPPTVKTIAPTKDSVNVCRSTPIQAGFSEAMDISTINTATVGLSEGANKVELAAPFDFPNIDFFTASQKTPPLDINKAYQVNLNGAGIKDTCGNSLDGNANGAVDAPPADDYNWGFTTGAVLECKPTITKLTPVTGYHDTEVVIDGENFMAGGNVKFNSGVLDVQNCFDPAFRPNQACLNAWAPTQIKVKVPAGGGASGGAIDGPVKVLVGEESNDTYFDNQSPHVNWISPLAGGVGQYVTISGSNFGSTKGAVNFVRESDGKVVPADWPPNPCPDTWSDDQIIVMMPYGFNKGDKLKVQVFSAAALPSLSNKYSNRMDFNFTDEAPGPGICKLSEICGSAGEELTITGERFGASRSGNNVFYNMTPAGSYNSWSANTINSVSNINLANNNYSIVVNVGGKPSNTLFYRIPCGAAPAVVEKTECDAGNYYPSPAPRSNETTACINTTISALFNVDMFDSDLIDASKIKVLKCNSGEDYNDSECITQINPVIPLVKRGSWPSSSEGFTFTPQENLLANTWYRVTIDKSMRAETKAKMADDYVWHFKTKEGVGKCPVETVNVNPVSTEITNRGGQAPFSAEALNNCVSLVSADYLWSWSSSNTGVATAESTDKPSASATATGLGNTFIKAETEGKNNQGRLDVNYCDASSDCTQAGLCPGSSCNLAAKKCTPVINSFSPANGNIGTWTTISGCYFGSAKGNVKFHDNKDAAWPDPGSCGDTWTDTSIQAEVPTGADTGAVKVIRADGAEVEGSNFEVNTTNYPGLCRISPNSGKFNDEVTLIGKNFGTLQGSGSVDFKGTSEYQALIKTWADKLIKGLVPIGAQTGSGAEGVKVIQTNPSNPLPFTVAQTCSPCQNDSNCPVPSQGCSIAAGCCVDRPTVDRIIPTGKDICRNVNISTTFNRLMDPASFTGNFIVKDGGVSVDGAVTTSDSDGKTTASFNPKNSLSKGSTIDVLVKKGVLSKDGVAMEKDRTWKFTTINKDSDCSDCGNGVVGPGEECDDGNITSGDGCSSSCRLEVGGAGQACQSQAALCTTGAGSCRESYSCASNAAADCRCCCTDIGKENGSGLKCTADISPCSGAGRGLFCGCTNDSQCAAGAEGCGTGSPRCCYGRPTLTEKSPTGSQECRNTVISGKFNEKMDQASLSKTNISVQKVGGSSVEGTITATETGFTFNPKSELDGNAKYQVTIKGDPNLQDDKAEGVKNTHGVGMNGDLSWDFTTKSEVCQIDKVEIFPVVSKRGGLGDWGLPFTQNEDYTILAAMARDKEGHNINADYSWTIDDSSIATITMPNGDGKPQSKVDFWLVQVFGDNKNGKTTLRVTADGTAYGNSGQASNSTTIEVFLCGKQTLWKYSDGATNFNFKYCMENGLPNFDNRRDVGGDSADLLKEFFFTRTPTAASGCGATPKPAGCDDAIGVRVMKNPNHLSPLNWYWSQFPSGGSPARTTVGGYEAVQDGRTIYVAATNLAGGTLYTNIYLISYNEKADASTVAVYNELVKNWIFNANEGDFGGSDQLVKVQRDTKRLADLVQLKGYLENYHGSTGVYPTLESGSYLKNFSTSLWPSWQANLGANLANSLPTDPSNKFDPACESPYAADTCWDQAGSKFSCGSSSHIYAFQGNAAGSSASLFANFEYAGAGSWINYDINTDVCAGYAPSTCACFNYKL